MTDEQNWQAPEQPDGQVPGGGYGASQPSYGPPVTGYSAPQPGPGIPHAPPVGGWAPPPKPGLIPLRQLTLSDILTASFQVLRRNPGPTLGFSLLVNAAGALLSGLFFGALVFGLVSRTASASFADRDAVAAGSVLIGVLGSLVPLAVSIGLASLVQAVVITEVQRATLGEKNRIAALWARAKGRLWALIGWVLLVSTAVLLFIALVVALSFFFVSTLEGVGILLTVLLVLGAGAVLMAGGIWLGTKLSMVPSILMGERVSLRQAISRSWSLTGQHFWRIFGITLLVSVILGFVSQIVTVPIQFIGSFFIGLLDPNSTDSETTIVMSMGFSLLIVLLSAVVSSVTTVIQSSTTALLYVDLRMRKEGLDLELIRYVERTQAGDTAVPDPYLPRTSPAAAAPTAPTWG